MKGTTKRWDYGAADFRREAGEDLRSFWETVSTGLLSVLAGAFSLIPPVVEAGIGVGIAALIVTLIRGGG